MTFTRIDKFVGFFLEKRVNLQTTVFKQDKAEARAISKKRAKEKENETRFPQWLWAMFTAYRQQNDRSYWVSSSLASTNFFSKYACWPCLRANWIAPTTCVCVWCVYVWVVSANENKSSWGWTRSVDNLHKAHMGPVDMGIFFNLTKNTALPTHITPSLAPRRPCHHLPFPIMHEPINFSPWLLVTGASWCG